MTNIIETWYTTSRTRVLPIFIQNDDSRLTFDLFMSTAVLCPCARHFTPQKYWLITQEAVAPSRHD